MLSSSSPLSKLAYTHTSYRPDCYFTNAAYGICASAQRRYSVPSAAQQDAAMGETGEASTVGGGNTTPPPTAPAHHTYSKSKNSGYPRNAAHKRPAVVEPVGDITAVELPRSNGTTLSVISDSLTGAFTPCVGAIFV